MARLVIESGAEAGATFPLDRPVNTIGRSVTNTIQIVDRRMSRNHLESHIQGSRLTLKDLGSKNGTLLNNAASVAPTDLKNNDRI
ncbi:FHA domain-containing protein, partial [Candidatus Sumerlaeota bacterium]|nr:FHA domain-containing protein [Candidatus Sumerlaeota bacterium]